MSDLHPTSTPNQPDPLRRKLAKGGLALPVVLATLASKPVLGAPPYNCTISGQLSGNTSSHGDGENCADLGWTPDQYAAIAPSDWPSTPGYSDWTTQAFPYSVNFPDAPASLAAKFRDAFEKESPSNVVSVATVRDVLFGCATLPQPLGVCPGGWTLRVKAGGGLLADEALALDLGREAVAACLNAIKFAPNFPLTLDSVVAMFNAVIVVGGAYAITPEVSWNASQVRDYFKSLHH